MSKGPHVEVKGRERVENVSELRVSGSTAMTGTLGFENQNSNYHIRANDSHLLLSSSVDSSVVAISGNLNLIGGSGSIVSTDQHLVLSSSVNSSVVVVSGNLDLLGGSGSINSRDQDLILSSTMGSIVVVSGNLELVGCSGSITSRDQYLIFSSSAGSKVAISGNLELIGSSGSLTAKDKHLTLSSSGGSIITNSGSLEVIGSLGQSSITCRDQYLILSSSDGSIVHISGTFTFEPILVHFDIPAGAASLGPTAPAWSPVGTFGGLGFDADAEMVHINFEIPDNWAGGEDMTFKTYWTNEAGVLIPENETVMFAIKYRSIVHGTEDIENGTIALGEDAYAQTGGAGTDGDTHISTIALAFDHADQPLTLGDHVGVAFSRSFSVDTYGSDIVVTHWAVEFSSSSPRTH